MQIEEARNFVVVLLGLRCGLDYRLLSELQSEIKWISVCLIARHNLFCLGEFCLHGLVRDRTGSDCVFRPSHLPAGLAVDNFQIGHLTGLATNDDSGFSFRSEVSISEGMEIEQDRLESTSGWGENIVDAKWWAAIDLALEEAIVHQLL
jgi:hypothetical protein